MFNYNKVLDIIKETEIQEIKLQGLSLIDDYIKELEMELDFYKKEVKRKNDKLFSEIDKHISVVNYPEDDLPF